MCGVVPCFVGRRRLGECATWRMRYDVRRKWQCGSVEKEGETASVQLVGMEEDYLTSGDECAAVKVVMQMSAMCLKHGIRP